MVFPNRIAHPKPEFLVEEEAIDLDKIEARRFDMPEAKLKREITPQNAKAYLAAVISVRDTLLAVMDDDRRF